MKKVSDVLGWQKNCVEYHKCPICYGCRNYNSSSLKCRKCAINRRKNICNISKHTSEKMKLFCERNEIMNENFPEILLEDNYFNYIKSSDIKKFTYKSLQKYGNMEKFIEANAVADYVDRKLKNNKIKIDGQNEMRWIDLLLSATLLHNLFYDGTLHSIFFAREKLTAIGIKSGMTIETMEPIFQAIEGQLGEDMPVPSCRVNPNSPSGILAEACWNIEECIGNKKLPDLTKNE